MTEAANRLHIAQPNLSRTIRKIEEELGYPLFDRKGGKFTLNKYGEEILAKVEILLSDYDAIFNVTPPKEDIIIHIGIAGTMYLELLLPRFAELYPDIQIKAHIEKSQRTLEKLLRNGTVDLLISPYLNKNSEFEEEFLLHDRACVSVPLENPLSCKKILTKEDLQNQSFIIFDNEGYVSESQLIKMAGDIHISYLSDIPFTGLKYTDHIHLLNDTILSTRFQDKIIRRKTIPVEGIDEPYGVYAFFRKESRALVSPFVEWIKEVCFDL